MYFPPFTGQHGNGLVWLWFPQRNEVEAWTFSLFFLIQLLYFPLYCLPSPSHILLPTRSNSLRSIKCSASCRCSLHSAAAPRQHFLQLLQGFSGWGSMFVMSNCNFQLRYLIPVILLAVLLICWWVKFLVSLASVWLWWKCVAWLVTCCDQSQRYFNLSVWLTVRCLLQHFLDFVKCISCRNGSTFKSIEAFRSQLCQFKKCHSNCNLCEKWHPNLYHKPEY